MNKVSVAVVLLSVIALVNAQCSCQSKPPVDIKYQGEACECGRQYPIHKEVPKITEHRDAHYDYGFTIERPREAPAEVKYTFDFHMEKPKPLPRASLASYAFEVDNPVQKVAQEPQRYSFDYRIQTPVVKSTQSNLEGLVAHVDKIVLQKQDCQDKSSCQCSSYKPTIDMLQRCPKHGHLYQYGGPLCPLQQRYNKDFSSIEQRIPYQVPTMSDRSKRNVASPLPSKINGWLTGLHSKNQILKVQSTEDRNQNRIAQIIKQNFGEDPTDNIDELLKPKPFNPINKKIDIEAEADKVIDKPPPPAVTFLSKIKPKLDEAKTNFQVKPFGSMHKINGEADESVTATSAFLSKIKPKLEEAKVNFRSQIAKIVNKARLDVIKANHKMEKRSIETDSSVDGAYFDESFEENYEPIWIADESVEDQGTENKIDNARAANDDGEPMPINISDRFRKNCDRCGELAKKFPCPSCGAIPSEASPQPNFQMNQQKSIRYAPKYQPQQLTPATDDDAVGSYHYQPAYGELEGILSKNSQAMHFQNRRVGHGHLLQPMNFEHASAAIRFIQELTQRNNQNNGDYYSHDVGGQNFHSKRSFEIVPLAEKEDGSVFVKISPIASSKSKVNEKAKGENPSDYTKYLEDDETQLAPKATENKNNFGNGPQNTNFQKFVRNGKKYEILALDSGDEESTGSQEDLEILKYVYAVNQKGHSTNDDEFGEIIEDNKLTDTYAQVET